LHVGKTAVAAGMMPAPLRTRAELVAAFRKPAKACSSEAKIPLAQVTTAPRYPKAVNLDYAILIGSTNSWTFKSDETTYISGNFNPTNAILEGGTVIKLAPTNGACIYGANLTFLSTNYRPVVVSVRDDDSVGSKITGSSGWPVADETGVGAFEIFTATDFHHLRISYADVGIIFTSSGSGSTSSVRHCQFVHCNAAIQA